VQDEHDAYLLLEELRWHGKPVCPHCGYDEKAYFLEPKGGSRGTGAKDENGERKRSIRRVWKCARCRKQFSVLTNTIFHGTKVPLSTWLTVMVQMCSAKNGISAREVERMHGVTPETAWFMLHRLRESMKREPLVDMLRGRIVADETFIGGKPKNKHQQGKPTGGYSNRKRGGGQAHLQPVLSLVNRDTGEVRSMVVRDVTGATLRKHIAEHVDMPASTLHTDAAQHYRKIGDEFAEHQWVDHSEGEYVRNEPDGTFIGTNPAEGYFSQLKRSIDGTHHKVSSVHLPRYLAEFDFRYSTRKLSDSARTKQLFDQVGGRRLTYRPLVGG